MNNSKDYLDQLGHKATTYFKAREAAIDYIKKQNINETLAVDLIVISQIWTANFYNETIREKELALRLNIPENGIVKNEELLLTDEMKDLRLVEVFERYINNAT